MYLWIKAFHIIGFVSWMAVLFYLPRLFVYHVENKDKQEFVSVIKIMEKRLFFGIGLIAFLITYITGTSMIILNPQLFKTGMWFHLKLTLVGLMTVYFFHNWIEMKKLQAEVYTKTGKFYRMYNEIPTILFVLIAIFAVVRPF
ncbi:MAG: protoporphyrinogen oxidase HemJ [Aquificae bacterium]|nr:protoporphyrinogen oxidase HemJ [Aquificota bacterium]